MGFFRAIWLIFFTIGAAALVALFGAFDQWANVQAAPGAETFCQGTFAGTVPVSRAPTCFALWFLEAKSWLHYAGDVVVQVRQVPSAMEVLRTADVGLLAVGGIALAAGLNWLWATAMSHVTVAIIAGLYSLLQGLAHMFGRRAA